MKKLIALLLLTAGLLMADGLTIGADTGIYKAGKTDIKATQVKVGYKYTDFNFYVYGQNDKLEETGISLSDKSYGAGVDYYGSFGGDFGYVVGTSYGKGDIAGFGYKDYTAKVGLTFGVFEFGAKAKRFELDDAHDNFYGAYVGFNFGG